MSVARNEEQTISDAIQILESRIKHPTHRFYSSGAVKNYLVLQYASLDYECFGVLFFDKQQGLIEHRQMFKGTVDFAYIHYREVLRQAMELNASIVILVHNHPSGLVMPSERDQQLTDSLKMLLSMVDVKLLDHIIVAGTNTYSFAEAELL